MRRMVLPLPFLVSLISHAQVGFADPLAYWYVAKTYPAGAPEDPGFVGTTSRLFTITGDSVVDGATWSVFTSQPTHPDGDPDQFEGLARQQGDLVLGLREDLSVDTLYDFGLDVGDSTHYLVDGWLSTWLHVVEVDSLLVGGSYRRLLRFAELVEPPTTLRESWIVGIGSVHGPLFPAHPVTFSTEVPGDSLMLTCYGSEDAVLWQHPDYDDCAVNILLSTNDLTMAHGWVIDGFPQPRHGSDHYQCLRLGGSPDPRRDRPHTARPVIPAM